MFCGLFKNKQEKTTIHKIREVIEGDTISIYDNDSFLGHIYINNNHYIATIAGTNQCCYTSSKNVALNFVLKHIQDAKI